MNKYSNRALPSVNRESQDGKIPDTWYNEFINNLKRHSAQSQRSIYEDINAIMGNTQSRYSSVEEAVQDMQERTGLKALMEHKRALAFIQGTQEPAIFAQIPQMKAFIDNFIEDRPGTSVESVVHDLLNIDNIREQLPNRSDVDDDVRVYINSRLAEKQGENIDHNKIELNIGKVDHSTPESNTDPLAICEPTKYSQ